MIENIDRETLSGIRKGDLFQEFRRAHLSFGFEVYPVCGTYDLRDAYANVWEKSPDGSFAYSKIKPLNVFGRAHDYR